MIMNEFIFLAFITLITVIVLCAHVQVNNKDKTLDK